MVLFNTKNENVEQKLDELSKKIESNEIKNPRDELIETEEKLKEVIDKILSRVKRTDWEKDPDLGFGVEKYKKIEKRIQDKRTNFPTQKFSDRLLDHATILDLKTVVEKNKDVEELKKLFPPIKRNIELLSILGENRNLILHHEKEVKNFQKLLVSGICGYFVDLINNHETGISRNVVKCGFEIYLKKDETEGIETAQKKILEEAQQIFNKTSFHLSNQTDSNIEPKTEYVLKKDDKEIKISFSNFTRGSTAEEGKFVQRLNVSIFSNNYELIKQLSKYLEVNYWLAEWVLLDTSIDALSLIHSIKESTGKRYSGSRGLVDGTLTSESIEGTIIDTNSIKIWSTITGGINIPTVFRIRELSGDNKFKNVFECFNPDIILKNFYGELRPIEMGAIVSKACIP